MMDKMASKIINSKLNFTISFTDASDNSLGNTHITIGETVDNGSFNMKLGRIVNLSIKTENNTKTFQFNTMRSEEADETEIILPTKAVTVTGEIGDTNVNFGSVVVVGDSDSNSINIT